MAGTKQYDSFLGGTQELPRELSMMEFSQARINEIKAMKQSLASTSGTKLAFQKLPKHMRRRAMSHNVKRLPIRLREIHLNQQQKSGMPPKQKRPSRKHRRRPSNQLSEYERRKRKIRWLETHIWHAKRFHMIEKWGYRLGERPCDKAFRACYRATSKYCLVQDTSFFSCIEVSGESELLLDGFKNICNANAGLTLAAKAFIDGCREGETVLFHNSTQTAIGTVYFTWKPTEASTTHRTVWLWIHPAHYKSVLSLLLESFCLEQTTTTTYSNPRTQINLAELKDELNRFRLTGPKALNVLQSALPGCAIPPEVLVRPHSLLYVNVTDPRLNSPKTETLQSIWDKEARQRAMADKRSNAAVIEMRRKLLVPGSSLNVMSEPIPIAVIHKPGTPKLGYASGWDIIFPSGWGQPFWLSLIMNGARPGGLREFDSIRFESGLPPLLPPDTLAGQKEEKYISENAKSKFFRLPPNKRPNYAKFAITSPFEFNWKTLVREWRQLQLSIEDISVMRNKRQLIHIQDLLERRANSAMPEIEYNSNVLIPVRVKMLKGIPKRFAIICLPETEDLTSKREPIEPLQPDRNELARKITRNKHKSLLKEERKRRIRAKKTGQVLKPGLKMLSNYTDSMRKLWLPEAEKVVDSCSRKVIGYVTFGDFSFTCAQGMGVGYIALPAIPSLLSNIRRNQILIRNTCSRQYRFGTIEIIF